VDTLCSCCFRSISFHGAIRHNSTALDGFGGRDTLTGIDTVHPPTMGGTVIGISAAETVFVFGGTNTLDLGEGDDRVFSDWGVTKFARIERKKARSRSLERAFSI
jgi:hypothetical protein